MGEETVETRNIEWVVQPVDQGFAFIFLGGGETNEFILGFQVYKDAADQLK